jgi:type IV secretory pathway VirB2 component (pilin)
MIRNIKKAWYAVSSAVLMLPIVVSAQYSVGPPPGGMADQADANTLLMDIINWLLAILASLSILMIVVAGIMYITSQGDEGRVESAKKWLVYAIVGLVVALLGYVIVRAVSGALGAG